MPVITLLDGSIREFDHAVTVMDVAQSIGSGLAKATLAGRVNNVLVDASTLIDKDASLQIITAKDEEGVDVIRHSTAHLLAQAVKQLFPEAQVTIGPVIENGFYYDFSYQRPFTPDDLKAIEIKMQQLVAEDIVISRSVLSRDAAVSFFKDLGENYKAELIESISAEQELSLYQQGGFTDLCRGPHVPSTGKLSTFKMMKIAGAYWRGNSENEMLQRIYGTAWATKEQLDEHLYRLEEAEKRDHRKLGRELNLFHFQEEAQGMVFWHEKGWNLYRTIESYIRRKLQKANYIEVKTPLMVDRKLWEASGHWEKFREDMFTVETEDRTYALKPMSCPCHIQIFNQGTKSYRDLPIRMAEFGCCHRNESSGGLHGLLRVRNFVQDDGHIFCSEDQINAETVEFCKSLLEVYKDFGFLKIKVKFSDRPDVRAGEDSVWDKAESSLKAAVEEAGLEYEMNPGEGAFYGPKLEFVLTDAVGRDWQCGTFQVDFVLPERLSAEYVAPGGEKKRPVMLHRAIIGTFERFIGILIEEYAGKFPLWLAPTQVALVGITNDQDDYLSSLNAKLIDAGIRSELDISREKVNYKIRNFSNLKVPIIAVVGKKEQESETVTLRYLGSDEQKTISVDELIALVLTDNKKYFG